MAKRIVTTTEFTDDIDGSVADKTVPFAFDGTDYEIDLSAAHADAFADAIALYVAHARRVRARPSGPRNTGPGRNDLAEVRAWASANGYDVAPRGRISAEVLDAYDSAHGRTAGAS